MTPTILFLAHVVGMIFAAPSGTWAGDPIPGCRVSGAASVKLVANTRWFEATLHLKGTLPVPGLWCLKITDVTNSDGEPFGHDRPLFSFHDVLLDDSRNVQPYSVGPTSQADLTKGDPARDVCISGELVHYQSIEEVTKFSAVHLETKGSFVRGKGEPPMRDWFPVIESPKTALTALGLKLELHQLEGGFGGSGPGYDDCACLPVYVVESTLTNGIDDLLSECHATNVDRVDAWIKPEARRTFYLPPVLHYNSFFLMNAEVKPSVDVQFHVARLVADKSFRFSLNVPVAREPGPQSEESKRAP